MASSKLTPSAPMTQPPVQDQLARITARKTEMKEYSLELARYHGSVMTKLAAEDKTIKEAQAPEKQLLETREKLVAAKLRTAALDEEEDLYADKMLPPTPAWLWAKAALQARRESSREFLQLLAEHRQRVESSASSSSSLSTVPTGTSRAIKRPQPPGLVTTALRSSHPEKTQKLAALSSSKGA